MPTAWPTRFPTQLPTEPLCASCHAPIALAARFCSRCGASTHGRDAKSFDPAPEAIAAKIAEISAEQAARFDGIALTADELYVNVIRIEHGKKQQVADPLDGSKLVTVFDPIARVGFYNPKVLSDDVAHTDLVSSQRRNNGHIRGFCNP